MLDGNSRDMKRHRKNFPRGVPITHDECLVDPQTDVSDAKTLNTNAKYWEKHTGGRTIA